MNLFKSTLIYGISNALIPATAFVLLVVLTNYLTPVEYGMISMFVVIAGVGQAVIGANVHGAIGRRYYDQDEINLPQYITNGIGIIVVTALGAIGLSIVLNPILLPFTLFTSKWFVLILSLCACQIICWTMSGLWVSMAKPIQYTLFQLYISLTTLCSVLILVVHFDLKWEGRIIGQSIAVCSASLIALIALYRKGFINLKFRKDYIHHALAFGVPLIPHSIGMWIITATDHLLIKAMISMEELGLYGVGTRIGMLIMLVQDAFNRAWMPQFYKRLKKGGADDHLYVIKVIYGFNVAIFVIALAFGFVAPHIFGYFLGPAYAESSQFVIWIALGYAFNGMYKLVANIFYYLHKTKVLAAITVICATLNIVISIVLINKLGSIGAAIGTMLAFFIMYVLTHVMAVKHYDLPWNPLKLWLNHDQTT